MFILDTNILSALMRDEPHPRVIAWLDRQAPESIWTTAITAFEIRYGLEKLPDGKKRRKLEIFFERLLSEELDNRILAFDAAAAQQAAILAAKRHKMGRNIDASDTMIAAIALARRAKLVTRNVRHFNDLGIDIVNPWPDH